MKFTIPGVEFIDPKDSEKSSDSHIIYGHFQCGKSHLMADAIEYYTEMMPGSTCLYLAIGSEDPTKTISRFEIGSNFANITTLEQFTDLMFAIRDSSTTVDVLALDSIKKLFRIVMD